MNMKEPSMNTRRVRSVFALPDIIKHPIRVLLASCLPLFALTTVSACAAQFFPNYSSSRIVFSSAGNELYGTLILPDEGAGPFPVAIFVHGDGAAPADYHGYYPPMWSALAARGIASFSWDKPGIGDSTGNWLAQDMEDRADEVVAAYRHLSGLQEVAANRVGVIGFSQAGWVLPRLATQQWADYMIFVSPAVNWIEQGAYLTRQRLAAEGVHNEALVRAELARHQSSTRLLRRKDFDYQSYLRMLKREGNDEGSDPMSKAWFGFAKRNVTEDATRHLADIEIPVLAIFGEDDLNIDVKDSVAVYRRMFESNSRVDFDYRVFADATHQLWKSSYANEQVPGLYEVVLMNVLDDDLFADGALDTLSDFVAEQSHR